MSELDDCSICLAPLYENRLHHLSCGHKLHACCWNQVRQHGGRRCSLCRSPQTTLARVQDHPKSKMMLLLLIVTIGLLASFAVCGVWSRVAVFDVQVTTLELSLSSLPSAGPFFRSVNFETCSNAEDLSGMLGFCVCLMLN